MRHGRGRLPVSGVRRGRGSVRNGAGHPPSRSDLRAAAPALLRACRQLHDALSEFLECPDPRTADRQAALKAIDASFAAPAKVDGAGTGNRQQGDLN